MSTNSGESQLAPVDVVILTAITLEYSAVLKVDAGAYSASQWIEKPGANKLPLAFRTFQGCGGRPLHVAVGQAGDMGSLAVATALSPLVEKYKPRCIAMSGVCAGRPSKTNLGDVIAAERLFFHDTGKQLPDEIQQDLRTYNLRDDWRIALERFDFSERFKNASWWQNRPIPYEWQENWLIAQLYAGIENPSALPECNEFCSQWEKVIDGLWKSGDVKDGTLVLTEQGHARVQRMLIRYRNNLPDLSPSSNFFPFRVHVAPIGSGNKVMEDQQVWSFISEHMRKTLGLDMEAVALGAIAHAHRAHRLDALVLKGVMDFANDGRDDHFKEFAARASAECLIAFLREHVEVDAQEGAPSYATSTTVSYSESVWTYPDWEQLIEKACDTGTAFGKVVDAGSSEAQHEFREIVNIIIDELGTSMHLPSTAPDCKTQLALQRSKLERLQARIFSPGSVKVIRRGIENLQELLRAELLVLLRKIYGK